MPTAILKLRGHWHSKAREAEAEMTPVLGIPDPPANMGKKALEIWKYITPQLHNSGVLAYMDRDVLALYCKLTAEWWKLDKWLNTNGSVVPVHDKDGNEVGFEEAPQWKQKFKLTDMLLKLAREFGLTPSARSRIQPILSGADAEEQKKHSKFFASG
jgi:P27 family predicted phage terminase small subunit|tara:strand:- start:878 stop:1348 length:471 start_codon:yes stop_codon:yes gene_type:complete